MLFQLYSGRYVIARAQQKIIAKKKHHFISWTYTVENHTLKGELTVDEYRIDSTCQTDGGITPLPKDPQVAMAYIPFQQLGSVYTAERALDAGTLFPELDKPFYGRRGEPR